MTHTLSSRWGDSVSDCTPEDIDRTLAELDTEDPEHPDAWLSNDELAVLAMPWRPGYPG